MCSEFGILLLLDNLKSKHQKIATSTAICDQVPSAVLMTTFTCNLPLHQCIIQSVVIYCTDSDPIATTSYRH